jgi:hypothetical protein
VLVTHGSIIKRCLLVEVVDDRQVGALAPVRTIAWSRLEVGVLLTTLLRGADGCCRD